MSKIVITGATGNIGQALLQQLAKNYPNVPVIATARTTVDAQMKFSHLHPNAHWVEFDFGNAESFDNICMDGCILFLLRPPALANVDLYFEPFLKKAKQKGVRQIVFLSVQGAERMSWTPHSKIERCILNEGFHFIFLRPGYFMQNLWTSLKPMYHNQCLQLPSGHANFNWIDIQDIAAVAAECLVHFPKYANNSYPLTGAYSFSFSEAIQQVNEALGTKFTYRSIPVWQFIYNCKKRKMAWGEILVMTVLHFLPRLQAPPPISDDVQQIIGKNPSSFIDCLQREGRNSFLGS